MIPAFLEVPLPTLSSPTPYSPGLLPPSSPTTKILLMDAQICKLFNLISSRVTGYTLLFRKPRFRIDLSLKLYTGGK